MKEDLFYQEPKFTGFRIISKRRALLRLVQQETKLLKTKPQRGAILVAKKSTIFQSHSVAPLLAGVSNKNTASTRLCKAFAYCICQNFATRWLLESCILLAICLFTPAPVYDIRNDTPPLMVTLFTISAFLTTFILRLRFRHFNYHS